MADRRVSLFRYVSRQNVAVTFFAIFTRRFNVGRTLLKILARVSVRNAYFSRKCSSSAALAGLCCCRVSTSFCVTWIYRLSGGKRYAKFDSVVIFVGRWVSLRLCWFFWTEKMSARQFRFRARVHSANAKNNHCALCTRIGFFRLECFLFRKAIYFFPVRQFKSFSALCCKQTYCERTCPLFLY